MECWDYRIFSDDTAVDALDELMKSRNLLEDLETYLDNVLAVSDDYIEYAAGEYGLVAAALVDVIQNGVSWELLTDVLTERDGEYVELVERLEKLNAFFLSEKAVHVIEAVEGENSELREMWEERKEGYPKWLENLHTIRERIQNNKNMPAEIRKIYTEQKMDEEAFFRMMDLLDWEQEGNDGKVLEPLVAYLAEWPDEVISAFDNKMAELLYALDSRAMAMRIYGTDQHFSGDDFLYIRCIALVNGQEFYQQVRDGKRTLRPDMEFESVLYVPVWAWARKHGEEPDAYPYLTVVSYETGSNRAQWGGE